MTVGIFAQCYHPIVNGVVVSVATFSDELRRLGMRVLIFAPNYPGFRDPTYGVVRLPSLPLPTNPRYPLAVTWWPGVKKRLVQVPLDIIHSQSPLVIGKLAARVASERKVPLVFTYHTRLEAYAHYVPGPQGYVRRRAIQASRDYANRADCVIAPSPGVKELLQGYGVTSRIEVIPTGIDLSLADPASLAPIRDRWAIPPDAPLLLYAGRIALEKNIEFMLEAFRRIGAEYPQARLLLVGGGPCEGMARRWADRLGVSHRVHFGGYLERQEVFRCCAEADLFLFPSLTDTQGIVLMEAMATGTPCVAIRSPATDEVIADSQDGLVTEPTLESFAGAVSRLLSQPEARAEMGRQARQRAAQFSSSASARLLAQVYQELCGKDIGVPL